MNYFGINDLERIFEAVELRKEKFPNEDEYIRLGAILMNYGDHLTAVYCMGDEKWEGQKKDLTVTEGIPKCPYGHPLMESPEKMRLALVPKNDLL